MAVSSGGALNTAVESSNGIMCGVVPRFALIPGHTVIVGWRPQARPSRWALWEPGVIVRC